MESFQMKKTGIYFHTFLLYIFVSSSSANLLQKIRNRLTGEEQDSQDTISPLLKIKKSYQQIYFGGDIEKLSNDQVKSYEQFMEMYAADYSFSSALNVSCTVKRQGPVRVRKNLRRERINQRRSDISESGSLRKRENISMKKSFQKCSTDNSASLTIQFDIVWSSSEASLNLEMYKNYYEQFMRSLEGRIMVLVDLQEMGVCVNKIKGFGFIQVTTISPTSYETSVPTIPSTFNSSLQRTLIPTLLNETSFPSSNMSHTIYPSSPTNNMTLAPTSQMRMNSSSTNKPIVENVTISPSNYSESKYPKINITLLPTYLNASQTISPSQDE